MRRAVGWLGVIALAVAVLGVIVQLDVRHQRGIGEDFLAHGVRAVATEVELEIESGKGGTSVDVVRVLFRTAEGQEIRSTLTSPLGDPEGAREGRRAPAPGTRYAVPLELRYRAAAPTEVIALVDAEDIAHPGTLIWVTWTMLAVGVAVAVACGVGLSRTKVAS